MNEKHLKFIKLKKVKKGENMKIRHVIIFTILALIFIPLVSATTFVPGSVSVTFAPGQSILESKNVTTDPTPLSTVPGVSLKPDLTIIKTTSVPNYGASGKTIPYNYTVKNTGNTNITDVNVTDITLGQTITLNSTTGSLVTPATILAPG